MPTPFDYRNLPDGEDRQFLTPVPEEFAPTAMGVFLKAVKDNSLVQAVEIQAAHLFDRKDWLTAEAFGHVKPNMSYRDGDDDVFMQVSIRFTHPNKSNDLYADIKALDENIREQHLAKMREALEAEEAAEAERAAAHAEKMAKRRAEIAELSK